MDKLTQAEKRRVLQLIYLIIALMVLWTGRGYNIKMERKAAQEDAIFRISVAVEMVRSGPELGKELHAEELARRRRETHIDEKLAIKMFNRNTTAWEESQARIRQEEAERKAEEEAKRIAEEEARQSETVVSYSEGYSPEYLMYSGVVYWNGYRFTWYSERVLPGYGLDIPGRWSDGDFVRDESGYICVASSDMSKGTVVDTPWGAAKVYDSGCASGTIDMYVSW